MTEPLTQPEASDRFTPVSPQPTLRRSDRQKVIRASLLGFVVIAAVGLLAVREELARWLVETETTEESSPNPAGKRSQKRFRTADKLRVGDLASDFQLQRLGEKRLGEKQSVALSSHRGRHPVCLVFGNYT